ncbi:uncharacterized protein LOC143623339 [Bidens hawaiensis]|uniref:uncharacterized protein LOC143623339 n=1 Tax=Bidens hawaiensis TaxID=980011 RepID=UPI004049440D
MDTGCQNGVPRSKKCLMELPTLTAPREEEPLILYLSASDIAIGAVLLMDRKAIQTPIYYVNSIEYKPRTTIKGQVLADFVTKIPTGKVQECLFEQQPPIPSNESQQWTLFTDGASTGEGSGPGLKLINPDSQEFTYAIKLNFKSTNNEAEYEEFLAGLRIAKKIGVKFLEAWVDSMLIAG